MQIDLISEYKTIDRIIMHNCFYVETSSLVFADGNFFLENAHEFDAQFSHVVAAQLIAHKPRLDLHLDLRIYL